MLLQGVRSYDIHYNEKEGIDELTLHMDAVSNRHGNLDSFLEQGGKTDGSDKKLKELTELLNRMIENIKSGKRGEEDINTNRLAKHYMLYHLNHCSNCVCCNCKKNEASMLETSN